MKTVVTFGTFDILHPWHEYYLRRSRDFWDFLITIVARDENVKRIKWKLPYNNEKLRLRNLAWLWLCDKIILWYKSNPYLLLKRLNPDVLCFWYDQSSFNNNIDYYLRKYWLTVQKVYIKAYHPNKFKSSILRNKLNLN